MRAIGQKDPLLEYQFESYNLFTEMTERVRLNIAEYLFRVSVVKEEESKGPGKIKESKDLLPIGMMTPTQRKAQKLGGVQTGKSQPIRKGPKVGRNDPCPCGSGKKYKHCCGKGK